MALTLAALTLAGCSDQLTEPRSPIADAVPTTEAPDLAATTTANTWLTKADMPDTPRDQLALAAVPNSAGQSIVYAIGGHVISSGRTGRVQAYNVTTNTWASKQRWPVAAWNTNGTGVINGKIYISGGVVGDKSFSAQLYMYDPATNVWTRKSDMPDATWGGMTGVINNQLYVLTCGQAEEDCYLDSRGLELYRYNPATDQWAFLGFTPPQVGHPFGGVIGGKLYFTGANSDNTARLTMYDPVTNQYTPKTPLSKPRTNGSAFATASAKLYIFGGIERQPDGTALLVQTTRIYNPATDSWSVGAKTPTLRFRATATRVFLNGKPRIEVVGGDKPGNNLQYQP
jgi:N-acetylneuraminic acid mutarotase